MNPIQWLDSFFEKAKVRYFGLGLLLAWVYCSWFSPAIFDAGDSAVASKTLHMSLLFSAFGLIAVMMRPKKTHPLGVGIIGVSGVVVSATTALFLFAESDYVLIGASALGGFASAVLWVAWGELYCQIGRESAEACIPSALVVFVISAVVVCLIPRPFSALFSVLLPLASCVMLLLGKNPLSDNYSFPLPVRPFSQIAPSLFGLALCAASCSVATGFVVESIASDVVGGASHGLIVFYAIGGSIAGLIVPFAISRARKVNFSFLYEWVVPLIVFSLSFKAFGGVSCNSFALVLACVASLCVEILFYVIFVGITARGLCSPSEAFGFFRSAVQLGFLFGGVLGQWAERADVDASSGCLFLICICVLASPLFRHLQERFDGSFVDDVKAEEGSRDEGGRDVFAEISEAFKLSARESEVLGYLGRGRSVPYMRDLMMISKSTIETHIKHIYAKTGVHSKQELLDLIEKYQD